MVHIYLYIISKDYIPIYSIKKESIMNDLTPSPLSFFDIINNPQEGMTMPSISGVGLSR
jgi:hypothetical protein